MVERMDVGEADRFLEIGPGYGILTAALLETCAEWVVGVEVDPFLCGALRARFGGEDRFRLIEGDFLHQELDTVMGESPFRIAGNIPYAITSPILFRILESQPRCSDATLMVQKEVGERLVSGPGSKSYGIPSVIFQLFGRPEILFPVSRKAFKPVPAVDSVVVSIQFFKAPRFPVEDTIFFKHFLKTVFGQRRKMIRNSIKPLLPEGVSVGALAVDGSRRPESLSVEQLVRVANALFSLSPRRTSGRDSR